MTKQNTSIRKSPAEKLKRKGSQKGNKKTSNAKVNRKGSQKGKKSVNEQPREKKGVEFFRNVHIITPDLMEDYKRLEDEAYNRTKKHDEEKISLWKERGIWGKEGNTREAARLRLRGFVFNPSDELLVDCYLKEKNSGKYINPCPIEQVDVYGTHPQTLTEKYNSNGGVWHFFTKGRAEVEGQWELGEKYDVFCNGEKVGVKQELEYNGGGKYKMIEYRLDPATATTSSTAAAPWFICKLYNCV